MSLELVKQYANGYYAIDCEISRDLQRFELLKDKWKNLDDEKFKQVGTYFALHGSNFKLHNHGADEHFMPPCVQRLPELGPVVDGFAKERKEINKKIERINGLFQNNDKAKVEASLSEYAQFVRSHMQRHMQEVMFQWVEKVGPEIQKEVEKEVWKELSQDDQQVNLAWLTNGMSEEKQTEFLSSLPWFVRLLYRFVLKPQFEKQLKVFREFGGQRLEAAE